MDPTDQSPEEVYSVWALPPEPVRDRFRRIMEGLRAAYGGPAFEPHVTVVGDFRGRRSEAVKVVGASDHCCANFGYNRKTPYMPHVSLLYGDLTDEEKEEARKKAEELDKDIYVLEFEISELALYRTDTTDKTLESWELVEVCHLGS
uniref:Cyclic phosphodiesterase n=1 Tax=Zea mays TaxID=4577 RepID=A0A804Q3W4_MAIZE